MRFLYLVTIFLVGVTVLTYMGRQLEFPGTRSPEPLDGSSPDNYIRSQRFLQVYTAGEEDTSNVKDKPKEERGDMSLWNELSYNFAWMLNKPGKAFSHIAHYAEQNGDLKMSAQFHDWFLRLVKFRARGKKFDDNRLYKLLKGLDISKSKLVTTIASLRSDHGLTEVADTMLGKLACDGEMTELVFDVWLKCEAHPAIAFNSFLERRIGVDQKFVEWLNYIESYRKLKTNNFSDEDLFRLLTNDKLHSDEVMVNTFDLLLHLRLPASYGVAHNMMIYMITHSATSKLVLDSMLASYATPRGVFGFLRLDKPGFDINLFEPWVKYCENYQRNADATSASSFSDQDFARLLESIPDSDLKQMLTFLQKNSPEISRPDTAQLPWKIDETLKAIKSPREYFISLQPAIKVDVNNYLFKRWLEYVQLYWQKRATNTFSDDELFHLLTDGERNSCQAVVETFVSYAHTVMPAWTTVAEAMVAYMTVNTATTKLVLETWLLMTENPKKIFNFRRLGKPEFDSDFMTQWLYYVKMLQAKTWRSGFYHFDDYECVSLLRSKKSSPDLEPMLKSLLKDPTLNYLADAALVDLKLSKSMDIWLADSITPGNVWAMLPSKPQVNSDNFIFRRWILYIDMFWNEENVPGGKNLYTSTDLFDFMKLNKITVWDMVTLFESLEKVPDTKHISEMMLEQMTGNSDLSLKVIEAWTNSGGDLYEYFKVFPLKRTPWKTIGAWFDNLAKSKNRFDPIKAYESLFAKPILQAYFRLDRIEAKSWLMRAREFPDTRAFADTLLKSQDYR